MIYWDAMGGRGYHFLFPWYIRGLLMTPCYSLSQSQVGSQLIFWFRHQGQWRGRKAFNRPRKAYNISWSKSVARLILVNSASLYFQCHIPMIYLYFVCLDALFYKNEISEVVKNKWNKIGSCIFRHLLNTVRNQK